MSIICFLFNLETQKLRFKKKKFFIEIIIILLKYQNCKSKFKHELLLEIGGKTFPFTPSERSLCPSYNLIWWNKCGYEIKNCRKIS